MARTVLAVFVLVAGLSACDLGTSPAQPTVAMRTIDNTPVRPLQPEPAPMLEDFVPEIPLPDESVGDPDSTTTAATTDADPAEQEPATPATSTAGKKDPGIRLPFAPAIAMDPVDGQKLSITAETPMVEYKGQIYYFNSRENLRTFVKSPKQYLTGALARY